MGNQLIRIKHLGQASQQTQRQKSFNRRGSHSKAHWWGIPSFRHGIRAKNQINCGWIRISPSSCEIKNLIILQKWTGLNFCIIQWNGANWKKNWRERGQASNLKPKPKYKYQQKQKHILYWGT